MTFILDIRGPTISMLSPEGETNFISMWKSFEHPCQWSKLPNPISYIESYMMSDCLRLGMLASKTTLTNNDYDEFAIYLKKEREVLIEFFDDFVGLPNLHASCHLLRHARMFGTIVNTAVGIKEMVYHGGIDPQNLRYSVEFMNISQDFNHLFKDWFIMESSEADNMELEVCSQSSQFQNIILRKPVSVRNTNIKIDTVSFRTDLALAYESFGYRASLINKKYNFYEGVSYIQDIHNAEVQCHLNTDDIVTIQKADYGESFAVVRAIFKHKSNTGYLYPFIYVNWFEDTYKIHDKLDCPIYILRHDDFYCRIFLLTVIENVRKVHFVHDCYLRCKDNHNLENKRYLRNDFFF
ncbi:hypothetical protein RhiirA5_425541 [Rhizophagus irregularis]|uniref:Uncharacterized protein n=1 Tax=Rhizophagus irregularis TaxID=588596 RepID=A0A2N0P610_9GLOM|nr:hypothetical protein RhiirA5_425541 [Rhizophagus irregularis]